MKIRTKITLLFTILVTALLLLLAWFVYYLSSVQRKDTFRQRLQSRASNSAQLYIILGDTSKSLLDRIEASNARLFSRKSLHVYDSSGRPLYIFNASPNDAFKLSQDNLNTIISKKETGFSIDDRDAYGLLHKDARHHFIVVATAYDLDGHGWLSRLKQILLFSTLFGTSLSMLIGYLFSRQLLLPIANIIDEVNNISSHNLSQRIDAGSGQDELRQLADTFNELLNRLQVSFTTQRRFISNASHELNTPLTSISSQLEITLRKERSVAEYKAVLESVQEDVQQMRQLTKSLLEIAKTGSQGSIELKEVRLDEVLLKVTSAVQKISQDYQVILSFSEIPEDEKRCVVFGNADLLFSALKNIVENGCKYSNDHTSNVFLNFKENELIIEIRNRGDVITADEIDNIFLPFYRSPKTQSGKGFGLGLALAKRIIGIHKGSIDVDSDVVKGTCFTVSIPNINSYNSN
ncbi:HAMP domain-containing histidine kinase [Flavihumibacter rivuli]|uniref:HAMP domain-containing sensor histidine kinase n=1 Tax=Flavihumibacter rivuli TaxID=2838156 RepID=UPI001BDEA768|nr:ATP-binding protein [Flavihumibacter rivuli]ULQ55643.1 HAMP domain-containing histidine kinase [Flavihumibacter rivuli]